MRDVVFRLLTSKDASVLLQGALAVVIPSVHLHHWLVAIRHLINVAVKVVAKQVSRACSVWLLYLRVRTQLHAIAHFIAHLINFHVFAVE